MPGGKHAGHVQKRVFALQSGRPRQIVIPQEARRFFGISPEHPAILGNEVSGWWYKPRSSATWQMSRNNGRP
ncbi:MAG: hypothetical protein ACLTYN_11670 [Dysosmobacter welbionis]